MPKAYGRTARSSAFQWFAHRITGTFLIFLLTTHFWIQHYDRTTASISHSVVTAEEYEAGERPAYSPEAVEAVEAFRARYPERAGVFAEGPEAAPEGSAGAAPVVPAQDPQDNVDAPGPTHPPAVSASVSSYDVLMLRLADPVYAVLWKGFNLLFLLFALHHGFYGLNNILTDYIRNDMVRVVATTLSWTVALVLLIVGAYSVIVAGL